MRPQIARRPATVSLPAIVVAASILVAGCGPLAGPTTSPDGAAAASPAGSASACESGVFPGWPRPGQVTTSGIIPVLASSEKLVGPSRLLFALVDDQNHPIADESLVVEIGFFDLCADPSTTTEVVRPVFTSGIEGEHAFYVATADLARPGPWGAGIVVRDPASGSTTTAKLQFTVSERSPGPRVGDAAPAVATLTLADVGGDVRRISSDTSPEPDFYEVSIEDALAASEPFLLAFATPAFCTSAQCGPTLEVIKAAVATTPIRVVVVEPFELAFDGGRLQPVLQAGNFVPVEAVTVYGIPTEPWIFIVDAGGTIASSFEAVVGEEELADAIRAVSRGSP